VYIFFLNLYGIEPLACFKSELIYEITNLAENLVGILVLRITRILYLYTEMQTILAPTGIRTHEPSVRAVEDSKPAYLGQRGQYDHIFFCF
jgi:hypothetical protein